ncbi:chromosomal replication initiator protein DnaA [Thermincola potens JR]|uniref:Chromosomal replication initiator protein DnaA n=1 Tax=Thermincola potens (strain JR) TaxID=635013 RepID=D5XE77_THEPJ|nr:chromosomal replication initiator protein DnaA [Thermincola potens]ADG81948.1 chromosomal replication initiator protein DnaA [Thermincola potens JR]
MLSIDLSELWQNALSIMKKQVSKPSFETWLKSTEPVDINNHTMTIRVPNAFARDWLETRYYNLIKNALKEAANLKVELSFIFPETGEQMSESEINSSAPPTRLNPRYTFDTFVVGNNNRLAHAAALAVAKSPAKVYNPLFICGGVGLGKTHLIQAIGNFALENNPGARVAYISAEAFTMELINAIRDDRTAEFRSKYRNMDILIIDDIHYLAGKERTQEEFFYTFNALYEANKQIIVAGKQAPKQLPALDESICSRFEGGLIADIQPPDLETRTEILRKRAEAENVHVPGDVITYIADQFHSNTRELEGALTRIILFASVKQSQITLDLADEALKGMFI